MCLNFELSLNSNVFLFPPRLGLANNFINEAKQAILFKQLSKFEGKKNTRPRLPHTHPTILAPQGQPAPGLLGESSQGTDCPVLSLGNSTKKGNYLKIT